MRQTSRDEAILDTLTRRVRVLGLCQVAETWWTNSARKSEEARSRLKQLEERGLVQFLNLLARPVPVLSLPLCIWKPGDPKPEFGAVSYRLRSRWTLPVRSVSGVMATAQAGNRFAGKGGRPPRASEATHDLCLAAVYLGMRTANPKRAQRWISEAMLFERGLGRGDRLPDAAIVTRNGTTAIEFGGAYPTAKVAEFHEFCAEQEWGYELW